MHIITDKNRATILLIDDYFKNNIQYTRAANLTVL